MDIPNEVMDYYQSCGMTKQEVQELHSQGIISIKTKQETWEQLETVIKELQAQSK